MQIVITGGAGFLGVRLARRLLAKGAIGVGGGKEHRIGMITLVDRVHPPRDLADHPRVNLIVGDLCELLAPDSPQRALPPETAVVFHLAAAVSGESEKDFELGMRSNFLGTYALLEACRAQHTRPLVVFASSLAVFGAPLPHVIEDDTLPTPQTSYGTQKFIGEQLMADYGRKGFIHARSVRLMTVCVRPGEPDGAASDFLSGMFREPLAGRPARCLVPPDTLVAISSPARAIEGLVCAASAPHGKWGPRTAVNLPSLCASVDEMVQALYRIGGSAAIDLLDIRPDRDVSEIISGWPGRFEWVRARELGLYADESIEAIVRDYVRENPEAVKLAVAA
ncbi:D-erythronate dehydrogenase [Variovorax humicola]|uniref:D-erythronate dehydrogenase n=1 Tax=Variovorax humicola TaxID=1769758 RepID=A0ABU8WB54_9BURK